MSKLNESELLHVADLARLELSDLEKDKFALDLGLILNDIEKINDIAMFDDLADIMISSSENVNEYHYVDKIETVDKKEALLNSKLSDGDYVVVPQVIND